MNQRRLATYLNDRYAILTAGTQLAGRAHASNADTVYGPLLERIAADLEEDMVLLKTIMAAREVSPDRVKSSLAWVGEKLGRLKPNDQIHRLLAAVAGRRARRPDGSSARRRASDASRAAPRRCADAGRAPRSPGRAGSSAGRAAVRERSHAG